ncbi:probable cytochrome P450 4d20 [Caerostris extrusa]|uniref:Probable cytochrome P450 4d20 n=1 Tax=Caerostris extrusa TaxID=172846 RepID=A0AAV4QHJ9_CAEEX|nr:probable cytochrome P450 4d20 [Caerostris extrusa]
MSRIWKFWQWSDFIFFHFSNSYRQILPHLRIVHGFSRSIIKKKEKDQALDEEGVRQEVDTFISAGHDTVTVAVQWVLYLIGLYPEVQEKIHQELDSVLGADSKGPLSVADLSELKYLDCVVKECFRIYPPVPIIARKVPEEITICGYTIPKRTIVIVNCIGRGFGDMEVKVLVCHILRSFSLHSLDSRDQVLPLIKITLQSSQPARIKFRRRQQ